MKYELIDLRFAFIIGDWVSGHWVWTIVSTIIAPDAKTPGHIRFDMGEDIDTARAGFVRDYTKNIAYFTASYAKAVAAQPTRFGLSAGTTVDEQIVQKVVNKHGLYNLMILGREAKFKHPAYPPFAFDRNGVTFGKVKLKFDTKDFFLSPSMFSEMYPEEYFMN